MKFCCTTKNDQNAKNVSITTVCHMAGHGIPDADFCDMGRSKRRSKRLTKLLLLRLKLSPEKIKNPAVVEKVFFFSLELEAGTHINLYSFESSMK